MKKLFAAILVVGLILFASPAYAAGSDSPPPYTVDSQGVTLPEGVVFADNGHVNIRLTDGTSVGIHFESLNNQPSGQWIGKNFLPWSAFGITLSGTVCVSWVQVWLYNEHFGEGGQAPVCATPPVVPPVEPPVEPPVVVPPVEPPVVVPPVEPPVVVPPVVPPVVTPPVEPPVPPVQPPVVVPPVVTPPVVTPPVTPPSVETPPVVTDPVTEVPVLTPATPVAEKLPELAATGVQQDKFFLYAGTTVVLLAVGYALILIGRKIPVDNEDEES